MTKRKVSPKLDIPEELSPTSTRGRLLATAQHLTDGPRSQLYGDCRVNMLAYGELMEWAEKWKKHCLHNSATSVEHDAAMTMVFAKISRIVVGMWHEDNYIDAAAYLAIAYENESRAHLPLTILEE